MRILFALLILIACPLSAQENGAAESATETETTENTTLILHTSLGSITIELFEDKAPKSSANFLEYARAGHYDGTAFDRVIGNFRVQCGCFDAHYNQNPTSDAVEHEADNGLENKRGTLAMARTGDPHSANSQFFLNVVYNTFLDHRSKESG